MRTLYLRPRGAHRIGAPYREDTRPAARYATARDAEPARVTIERTPAARVVAVTPGFQPVSDAQADCLAAALDDPDVIAGRVAELDAAAAAYDAGRPDETAAADYASGSWNLDPDEDEDGDEEDDPALDSAEAPAGDDEDTPQGDEVEPVVTPDVEQGQGDHVEPLPVPEEPDPIDVKLARINELHDAQDAAEAAAEAVRRGDTLTGTEILPAVDGAS